MYYRWRRGRGKGLAYFDFSEETSAVIMSVHLCVKGQVRDGASSSRLPMPNEIEDGENRAGGRTARDGCVEGRTHT
jgi:hypothetical protein